VARSSLIGRLLVATPIIDDPNFDRSVILVLAASDEGALGVVVNRASDLELAEALPHWADAAAEPRVVFLGGPVGRGAVICLGRARSSAAAGWEPVVGDVGTVDLDLGPVGVAGDVADLRIFSGYAGWSSGQLEGEVDVGAWVVVDAEPGDALSADPGGLWERVLRRQRGRTAWLANFPDDPTLN
jgi:putative transcriptional regulator